MIELNDLHKRFDEHKDIFKNMNTDTELLNTLIDVIDLLISTFKQGNKVLIAGNGGSAADSQHFATELVSRFQKERKALNAEALTTDTSCITAISNDYNFNKVFARQIEAKGNAFDIFIGLTTSGNSSNIVEAFVQAQKQGLINISITGDAPNMEIEDYVDYMIKIPSTNTARIQEATVFIYHILCDFIENEFE